MLGGVEPVEGGMQGTDCGRGTLLPGVVEGTGALQGVQVGDGGCIDGRDHDDTIWASSRGDMELDNLGHGGRTTDVSLDFPSKGSPQSCQVEVFPGRSATRTAMRVHFLHQHFQDTVVILKEINLSHPR